MESNGRLIRRPPPADVPRAVRFGRWLMRTQLLAAAAIVAIAFLQEEFRGLRAIVPRWAEVDVVASMVVALLFGARLIWRCPACSAAFGMSPAGGFCRRCGWLLHADAVRLPARAVATGAAPTLTANAEHERSLNTMWFVFTAVALTVVLGMAGEFELLPSIAVGIFVAGLAARRLWSCAECGAPFGFGPKRGACGNRGSTRGGLALRWLGRPATDRPPPKLPFTAGRGRLFGGSLLFVGTWAVLVGAGRGVELPGIVVGLAIPCFLFFLLLADSGKRRRECPTCAHLVVWATPSRFCDRCGNRLDGAAA